MRSWKSLLIALYALSPLFAIFAIGCADAAPPRGKPADGGMLSLDYDLGMPTDAAVADGAASDDGGGIPNLPIDSPGLPHIDNSSGASTARVLSLVHAAIDGLGFDPTKGQGPNSDDRMFIGRHYLVWVDQTGFYGKMNGAWSLNAAPGDALDFVVKDPDGRPVSILVPGEDGEGQWAPGYRGAEHVEFPSNIPEADDPPSCATGDWCNQYSLDEAAPITNPKIPWWSACNVNSASFGLKITPLTVTTLAGGLKLVYEGRLVKQADGINNKGTYDGSDCHADYLFSDGVRRPVYLRVGYELFADRNYIDRTMQIRNPAGNPQLQGNMSLIGGFVMTRWPSPYYLKRIERFWRPESASVQLTWNTALTLTPASWNDLSAQAPITTGDVLISWIDQPITLSPAAGYSPGRSLTLSHVGPSDNQDVGVCLCSVHGGIEMGGGLIHAGKSLPVAGGQMTIEAKRRLALPNTGAAPQPIGHSYDGISGLSHGSIGRADGDGWAANTAADGAGHMAFGPYATDWGGQAAHASFYLLVDNNSAANDLVVKLEIYDSVTEKTLASRDVHRYDFRAPGVYQRFGLDADLAGTAGHKMETRVWWMDVSYVRLQKVLLHTVAASDE
jgi:hypothetical protein